MRRLPKTRFRLDLETLEDRCLMAASLSASLLDGVLRITGTDAADAITVRQRSNQISIARLSGSYPVAGIQRIIVDGGNGHDTIRLDSETRSGQQPITVAAALFGGAGNDRLVGGAGADLIHGGAGNDRLDGRAGNDVLDGRDDFSAIDRLFAGDGDDRLFGERGSDRLDGGTGTNALAGFEAYAASVDTSHYLEWNLTVSDELLKVNNWQTFPNRGYPFYIKIDNEIMQVTGDYYGNYWTVNRGQLGTTAVAHAYGSLVTPYQQQTTRLASPRAVSPVGTISEAQPTFQWTAVPGAAQYELWIGVKGVTSPLYHIRAQSASYWLGSFTSTAALTDGQTYTWYVRAHTANEDLLAASDWSAGQDVTYRAVTLAQPTLVGPTGTTTTTAPTFSWNGVAGADRYDIWVNDLTANASQVLRTEVRGTSWLANRFLTPGHTYRWWVRALGTSGNGSAWSNPLDFTVGGKPGVPSPVTLPAVSATQVSVSWTDVSTETSYSVWYSADSGAHWTQAATLAANTTSHQINGLAPGTTYLISVGARNAFGENFTEGRSVTTLASTRPAPPAIKPTFVLSQTEVEVSWASAQGATGYRLQRWVNGVWQDVVDLPQADRSYQVGGLAASAVHYFRVGAFNAANPRDVSYSNYVEAYTIRPGSLSATATVTSTAAAGTLVSLNWSAAAYATRPYQVYLYQYGNWVLLGEARSGETSYGWFPGSVTGHTYYLQVVARNGNLRTGSNVLSVRV